MWYSGLWLSCCVHVFSKLTSAEQITRWNFLMLFVHNFCGWMLFFLGEVFAVQIFGRLVVLLGVLFLSLVSFSNLCSKRGKQSVPFPWLLARDELCNSLYSTGSIANPHRTFQLFLQPDFQFICSVALGSAHPFVPIWHIPTHRRVLHHTTAGSVLLDSRECYQTS